MIYSSSLVVTLHLSVLLTAAKMKFWYSPNKSFGFTKPPVKSGAVFNVGDCVQHKVFGKGMVMKAEKMGNDTMLEIAFYKAGTKTLMANYCSNMKKI